MKIVLETRWPGEKKVMKNRSVITWLTDDEEL
jgi:hypothetical protein